MATRKNILLALFSLAHQAKSGDMVTITFSTHGEFYNGSNRLYTYTGGQRISGALLLFALKWFSKGVRINLLLDICQGEDFLSPKTTKLTGTREEDAIMSALSFLSASEQASMQALIANSENIPLSAHIAEFATPARTLFVPDGILTAKTREVFASGYVWNWWKYNFKEFREAINERIDIALPAVNEAFCDKLIEKYIDHDAALSSYLNMHLKSMPAGHTIKSMLTYYLGISYHIYRGIIQHMTYAGYRFNGNAKLAEKFGKFISCWASHYDLSYFHNPHIRFLGPKSSAFESQYVFCIK